MVVTAGEDNEEGRKPLQISPVIFFRRRVNPRAASGGGEWEPHAAAILASPEAFLAVSWIFRGYYVIFYLCDMLSVLF